MKSYNGFTPEQRTIAGKWLRERWASGARKRPTICAACGQTAGRIDGHSESYAEPYGPHIGAFDLCMRCHLAVHCRLVRPGKWDHFRRGIRAGAMFPAADTWEDFRCWWFSSGPAMAGADPAANEPRERTILDDIHDGRTQPSRATCMIGDGFGMEGADVA